MPLSTPDHEFDTRWAAWIARGHAHERTVRRRMVLAVPIILAIAITIYVIVAR